VTARGPIIAQQTRKRKPENHQTAATQPMQEIAYSSAAFLL